MKTKKRRPRFKGFVCETPVPMKIIHKLEKVRELRIVKLDSTPMLLFRRDPATPQDLEKKILDLQDLWNDLVDLSVDAEVSGQIERQQTLEMVTQRMGEILFGVIMGVASSAGRSQVKEKIRRLCDLWVSHIEAVDHQVDNPQIFQLILKKEEKEEFGAILTELLSGKQQISREEGNHNV